MVIQSYESFYDRAKKFGHSTGELWEVDTFVVWTNQVFRSGETFQSSPEDGSRVPSRSQSPGPEENRNSE